MRLGAEFLELTTAAFESWAALNPTICKVRRGVFDAGAYVWVNACMRRYSSQPVFLLRSRTEIPDLHELQETLDEQLPMILGGGTEVWIEVMNEPNHPDTRTGLGDTLAEQVETYRGLLRQVVTGLRQSHPRVKLVAPGLMPEPGGISAWMVEERRLFDLDGFHLYGPGLEGLMLPARFYAPPVATEVGTPFPDRRVERITEMMAYCWHNWQPGAFVYFAVPSWTGPTGEHYDLPIEDAEDYANWHIELHREEEPNMAWKDRLPRSYQAFKAEGGTDENFESIIQVWVAAGGDVEESALRYLVGTRRLKATQSRIEYLINKGKSTFQELNDAVSPYLPLA